MSGSRIPRIEQNPPHCSPAPPSPNTNGFHAAPLSPQIHSFHHSWPWKLSEFASSISQGHSNLLPASHCAPQIWTQKVTGEQTLIPNTDGDVSSLRKEQLYQTKEGKKNTKREEVGATENQALPRTLENCPNHDKKETEQSRRLLLINNRSHTRRVFRINCRMLLLYRNFSQSLLKYGFLDVGRRNQRSSPALGTPQRGGGFLGRTNVEQAVRGCWGGAAHWHLLTHLGLGCCSGTDSLISSPLG